VSSIPNRWKLRLSESLDWSPARWLGAEWVRGLGVIADQAVVSLSAFLATAIVGRWCGPSELGVYYTAVTIFWLAASIPNALVWTPYTSRAARMPLARRALFAGSATLHSLWIGLALAVLAFLVGLLPWPGTAGSAWFTPMCLALAPFTLMMILREHSRRISLAHLQVDDLLAIDVPIGLFQLALLITLASVGELSAVTALLAIAVSCGGAIVWLARRRDRLRFQNSRAAVHWGYNQRFGRWLLFVSIMWLVGDSSYRWLVGQLHGLESLGQFAAAQNIVLCLNPLLLTATNLTQAMSADRFAKGGIAALRRLATRWTLLIAVWAGVAFLALAAVGGSLVELVFGRQYAGLGPVVVTLCLGMFARVLTMPIDGAMVALARGRVMVVAAIVRLALIVGAGVPLIAWRGLEGVGYAMAVSAAGGAAIQWWDFLRGGDHAQR
jgi:O-antigen/teichoic acid export membrane protein